MQKRNHSIQNSLSRILVSNTFKNSKRDRILLNFLVEHTLKGQKNEIKEYTIGVSVFNDVNFELGKSSIVRNQMVRLRKRLGKYYSNEGLNEPMKIILEKGNYTPKFVSKELNQNIIIEKEFWLPLIAVLPTQTGPNECIDKNLLEYISDELIRKLTFFSDVKVLSNYSINNFLKKGGVLENISIAFDVDYLVDCKVQIVKNDHFLVLQLVEVSTGICSWVKKYNLDFDNANMTSDLNNIIESSLNAIAGDLGIISKENHLKDNTPQLKIKSLYKALILARNTDMFPELYFNHETMTYLSSFINQYPNIAELQARYAILLINAHVFRLLDIPDSMQKAREHLGIAMNIDSSNQYVWTAQAILNGIDRKFDKMKMAIDKAIEVNPFNAYLVAVNGWTLGISGYYREGLLLVEKSMCGYPLKPYFFQFLYFLDAYASKNYALALNESQELHAPSHFWKPLTEALALVKLNNTNDAILQYEVVLKLNPDFHLNPEFYLSILIRDEKLLQEMLATLDSINKKNV